MSLCLDPHFRIGCGPEAIVSFLWHYRSQDPNPVWQTDAEHQEAASRNRDKWASYYRAYRKGYTVQKGKVS